jgi:hypothetical protein
MVVKTLAEKLTEERQEKQQLESKYKQAISEFEAIKQQLEMSKRDPFLQVRKQNIIKNLELDDSESDQEIVEGLNMQQCRTQSSFVIRNRETELSESHPHYQSR